MLRPALKEWYYTGYFYDYEAACEICQLCGKTELRFHFEIYNPLTTHALLVGSECIKRFEIETVDEAGRRVGAAEAARRVNRDRRWLVENARQRRQTRAILDLARIGDFTDEKVASFLSYINDRSALTPSQAYFLLWRMAERRIEHRPSDFKVTIKRDREKAQLIEMSDYKLRTLCPALSISQKRWLAEHRP
jgi:hypothetical protein